MYADARGRRHSQGKRSTASQKRGILASISLSLAFSGSGRQTRDRDVSALADEREDGNSYSGLTNTHGSGIPELLLRALFAGEQERQESKWDAEMTERVTPSGKRR